ncbi:MAG: class I tRNA ligase family protein, partial [Spirochaetia bacterium]|nr:class I tRNA ligase family protein [Spirochaetia bacterium]
WDISRDAPYFGFAIPGEKERYFYVWLDAPIGYMASSKNYFEAKGQLDIFDDFWKKGSGEVYHFIGKDIVYFHTLFWPALLHAGAYRPPTAVYVHGFLTVNGEKMSKSRGTLIKAATYLRYLDPQALRYFYASRLVDSPEDIDLAVTDFVNRYNSDVVGNFANIFSRLAGGLAGKLDHTLSAGLSKEGTELMKQVLEDAHVVLAAYESRSYSKAVRHLAAAGDKINKFVNDREPWKTINKDKEGARQVITDALTSGRILAGIAKPVLPVFAAGVEELLALPGEITALNLDWKFPANHVIRTFRHLAARLDPAEVEKMLEQEAKAAADAGKTDGKKTPAGAARSAPPAKGSPAASAPAGAASAGTPAASAGAPGAGTS